jgi:hypothetical protein
MTCPENFAVFILTVLIYYDIILSMYISNKITRKIYDNLKNYVDEIILLPDFDLLPTPVASHADMLMYKLRDSLLAHNRYYYENPDLFNGVKITLTNEYISNTYPNDILLNALNLGGTVYCKADCISKYIRADADKIVNLKQGYARCSTCIVSNNAVITADRNIADIVSADVLLIKEGHIKLDGYNYGFIGGASVKVGDNILFFGDISVHPDYEKITEFCGKYGMKAVSLSDEMLYDYGSMVII